MGRVAVAGRAADDAAGREGRFGNDGAPVAFCAGTRGNENMSLTGGNTGAVAGEAPFWPSKAYGDEPGAAVAPVAEAGSEAASIPPGGEVGGDDGIAGTAGKENISVAGGIVGPVDGGEILPAERNPGGATSLGIAGTLLGAPGTRAVTPAKEAAMARRSVSDSGPKGEDDEVDMPGGDCAPAVGTKDNISFGGKNAPFVAGRGNLSVSGMLGIGLDKAGIFPPISATAEAGAGIAAFCGSTGLPGSAAKNSFASRAISAGSGTKAIEANEFSSVATSSTCAGPADGISATKESFVFMILIDIDVLEQADSVIGQGGDRTIKRN